MSGKNIIVREKNIKRPGSGRQFLNAFFFIAIILGIAVAGYFLFLPKKETYTLKSYRYSVVKRENIINSVQASGTLTISRKQTILASQSGIIKTMLVSEGDSVIQNEQLAVIYSQDLEDSLNEVETSLIKKTRSMNNQIIQQKQKEKQFIRYLNNMNKKELSASENYQSYKRLYDAGAATKAELETAYSRWKTAQETITDYKISSDEDISSYNTSMSNFAADIKTLKEKSAYINEQINQCKILSPISGELLEIYTAPGQYISQFSELMTIADFSRPVVILKIPENEISFIKKNQKTVISLGNKKYDGSVYKIAITAEEKSGNYGSTIDVEIHFLKTPDKVIPGSSVSALILTGVKENVLCIPRGAYLTTGSERYVYIIKNNKAIKTAVNFGIMTDMKIEILSGLKENDAVIISGYQDYINLNEIDIRIEGGEKSD